jgi:PhnB protein
VEAGSETLIDPRVQAFSERAPNIGFADRKERKAMAIKPIPDGYHAVTPYLSIKGAAEAIEFYKRAFNATEIFRLVAPSGEIGHAEIKVGDSPIMLADACEESGFRSPASLGGSTVGLHLYVQDVDALFAHALGAGAKSVRPVQDQFYGDRSGTLEDPFGHVWFLATHKEDLSPEEINRRADALFKQKSAG